MVWIDLGLDIEAHARVAGLAHQREQLAQGGNACPRHGPLVGELLRVGAVGADLADVIGPDLFEPQLHERCAGRGDIGAACIPREIGIEPAFMRDDDLAIRGHADVELQRVHAHRQRVGEGRQGVFRQQRAPAAMRFEIKGHGLSRNENREHGQDCRGT